MKRKRLRRALISSIMSLTLCCAMLIGTTYAWLTESISSAGNQIVGGYADVQILTYEISMDEENNPTVNYTDITNKNGDLFSNTADKNNKELEPGGAPKSVYLAVKNNGNLDMKYQIGLIVKDAGLASLLKYSIVPVSLEDGLEEIAIPTDSNAWKQLPVDGDTKDENKITSGVSYKVITQEKVLFAPNENEATMSGNKSLAEENKSLDHFVLSVKMDELGDDDQASGLYKNTQCEINVCVIATQIAGKTDSSGETEADVSIAVPEVIVADYIYHFATVGIKAKGDNNTDEGTESDKNQSAYVTQDTITASSSNAEVEIELQKGMQVDYEAEGTETEAEAEGTGTEAEKVIVISVSPKDLTTSMDSKVSKNKRTWNVQLYGISDGNKTPFEMTFDIGESNRLVKVVCPNMDNNADNTTSSSGYEFQFDSNDGNKEDPSTLNEMSYEYDEGIGCGVTYNPEDGKVVIETILMGDYTLITEPIAQQDDTETNDNLETDDDGSDATESSDDAS